MAKLNIKNTIKIIFSSTFSSLTKWETMKILNTKLEVLFTLVWLLGIKGVIYEEDWTYREKFD